MESVQYFKLMNIAPNNKKVISQMSCIGKHLTKYNLFNTQPIFKCMKVQNNLFKMQQMKLRQII